MDTASLICFMIILVCLCIMLSFDMKADDNIEKLVKEMDHRLRVQNDKIRELENMINSLVSDDMK